ncbi:MAG: FeoB-associated Cys-rich membrane protein [Melioribacteraceae bacterium]
MNQDILVFAIILATISYVGFSVIKNLRMKKVKSGCGGCTGCELSQKTKCDY